jgi:hypothetical protein
MMGERVDMNAPREGSRWWHVLQRGTPSHAAFPPPAAGESAAN